LREGGGDEKGSGDGGGSRYLILYRFYGILVMDWIGVEGAGM
jgi:hypothetical protein